VRLTASASADGRTVVAIADDGPGIPVQEQGRVFERFYRGDRVGGGFGLGLSIARGAVRALGGEIELDSEPRRGTTVRLILQAVPQRELV
jgi:signal transduction histidine kinase